MANNVVTILVEDICIQFPQIMVAKCPHKNRSNDKMRDHHHMVEDYPYRMCVYVGSHNTGSECIAKFPTMLFQNVTREYETINVWHLLRIVTPWTTYPYDWCRGYFADPKDCHANGHKSNRCMWLQWYGSIYLGYHTSPNHFLDHSAVCSTNPVEDLTTGNKFAMLIVPLYISIKQALYVYQCRMCHYGVGVLPHLYRKMHTNSSLQT